MIDGAHGGIALAVLALVAALASAATGGDRAAFEDPALLREAIRAEREHAERGGWPPVAAGPAIRVGDSGPRIGELRRRLVASGDLAVAPVDPETFDDALDVAVRRFQARHGLAVDGIVGRETLRALNVPLERRIGALERNLERLERLPASLGSPHLWVNVPAFELHWIEGGEVALTSPVIVGRRRTPTPELVAAIDRVVLNPFWHVPRSIFRNELLRDLRRDPAPLAEDGFFALVGGRRTDVRRVDWSRPEAAVHELVQTPGPKNALGRVKLEFANRFRVYVHDTPAKPLFAERRRAFSHGCIRAKEAFEIARRLLAREEPSWTAEAIGAAIDAGRNRGIRLRQAVPIHVVYQTAWVAADGSLEFRDDLYGRDRTTSVPPPRPIPCEDPAEG